MGVVDAHAGLARAAGARGESEQHLTAPVGRAPFGTCHGPPACARSPGVRAQAPAVQFGLTEGGRPVKAVCVFCGSSRGARPEYEAAAARLGQAIARSGRTLVYGGGRVGLMGVLGDAAMAAGGRVIGVTPRRLVEKEVAHHGLTELRVVESMHARKAMMAELSDAFIAMPGGVGTFEEFFEVLTWSQLGFHSKPCGLLNVAGYYDPMLAFLDHAVEQGFVRAEHRAIVLTDTEPTALLDRLSAFDMPIVPKWIDRAST
jgi:uncharacterized protein (TIGR00730 family)